MTSQSDHPGSPFLNRLVDVIASWIRKQPTTQWRYHVNGNPGNLWDGHSPRRWPHIKIDRSGYLRVTKTQPDLARAAFHAWLQTRIRWGWTLRQLIGHWPRRSCKPSEEFIEYVQEELGLWSANVRLSALQRAYDRAARKLRSEVSTAGHPTKATYTPGTPGGEESRRAVRVFSRGSGSYPPRTEKRRPRPPVHPTPDPAIGPFAG